MIPVRYKTRLTALETRRTRPVTGSSVVWLPSPPPTLAEWEQSQAHLAAQPGHRVIALPRKAASAEQWTVDALARWNQLPPLVQSYINIERRDRE